MFGIHDTRPDDRGFCVCLECGMRVPGQRGVTSLEMSCPNCGAVLVREDSPYHRYATHRRLEHDLRAAFGNRGIEGPAPIGAGGSRRLLQGASAS